MITDYIGGEGSAETPKNDYVIYGWPLNKTDRRHTNKQDKIFDMADLKWKIVLFSTPIGAFRFLAFGKFHLKLALSSTVIANTIFIISGNVESS